MIIYIKIKPVQINIYETHRRDIYIYIYWHMQHNKTDQWNGSTKEPSKLDLCTDQAHISF